jgi:hypothetical protein
LKTLWIKAIISKNSDRLCNDEEVVTIKEIKDEKKTKVTTKMKEKNDKKKNL